MQGGLTEEAWVFVVQEYKALNKMCKKAESMNPTLNADELFSDVVLQDLPGIFKRYNKDKGPLRNFVLRSIRLQLLSCLTQKPKAEHLNEDVDIPAKPEDSFRQKALHLLSIYEDDLNQYDKLLLTLHFRHGYSRRKIADTIESTYYTVDKDLNRILDSYRVFLKAHGIDKDCLQ